MSSGRPLSIKEQTLHALREGLRTGRWAGALPAVRPLAKELGVSVGTLQPLLKRLEGEGVIESQGDRRRRMLPKSAKGGAASPFRSSLRVGLLPAYDVRLESADLQTFINALKFELEASGHHMVRASKSIGALRGDPSRVLAMLDKGLADVWVGIGCPKAVNEAVARSKWPYMACAGTRGAVKVASVVVNIAPPLRESVRRLTKLGHRRIVMLCDASWRSDEPTSLGEVFREELRAAGIRPSDYNLPEWEETRKGFLTVMRSLFSVTPPTALIVRDTRDALGVISYIAARGLSVPRHLSLVVAEPDRTEDWTTPPLAHFPGDHERPLRVIVNWVKACAKGVVSRKSVCFEAPFVEGESLGPAWTGPLPPVR